MGVAWIAYIPTGVSRSESAFQLGDSPTSSLSLSPAYYPLRDRLTLIFAVINLYLPCIRQQNVGKIMCSDLVAMDVVKGGPEA